MVNETVPMDHTMVKECEEVVDGEETEVEAEVGEDGEVIAEETTEDSEAAEGGEAIIVIEEEDVVWATEETTDRPSIEKQEIIEIVETVGRRIERQEMLDLKGRPLPETLKRSITGRRTRSQSRGLMGIESPNRKR